MLSESVDGGLVEADCSATPRFGLLLNDDSAGIVDRGVDYQLVPIEVQSIASQAREFASPEAGGRSKFEDRRKHFVVFVCVASRRKSSSNSGAVVWRGECVLVGNSNPSMGLLVTLR